jgi:hypothetical protein
MFSYRAESCAHAFVSRQTTVTSAAGVRASASSDAPGSSRRELGTAPAAHRAVAAQASRGRRRLSPITATSPGVNETAR